MTWSVGNSIGAIASAGPHTSSPSKVTRTSYRLWWGTNGSMATPAESVGDSPTNAYRSPNRSDRIQNSIRASLIGPPSGVVNRTVSKSAKSGRGEGPRGDDTLGAG